MTTITRERLQEVIDGDILFTDEQRELARIALASLTAEPVLYAAEETLAYANMGELHLTCLSEPMGDAVIPLYAAPPAPVVNADPVAWEWFYYKQWNVTNDQERAKDVADGGVEVFPLYRSSAMLNGAEPESNRDELPLDYLQGHKDGLEWSAQLAEANHPQTGDWLYDDPVELAKAIRKGPDMPEADGNSPVIPDGWVMVPVDMTPEQMRAVQIKSELGSYAAENLSGAYALFREFWDEAVAAAPQQEAE